MRGVKAKRNEVRIRREEREGDSVWQGRGEEGGNVR